MNLQQNSKLILLCTHLISLNIVASDSAGTQRLDYRIFKEEYYPTHNLYVAGRSITDQEYQDDLQAYLKDTYSKRLPGYLSQEEKQRCTNNHTKICNKSYNPSEYKKAQLYSKLARWTGSTDCLAKSANHYHNDRCNIDAIRKHDASWSIENQKAFSYSNLAYALKNASTKNEKLAQAHPIDLNPETNKFADLADTRLTPFGHATATAASFMRYLGKNNPEIN